MTSMLRKSDAQLKNAIEEELLWLPSVNSTHIGVAVEDGAVTLSGHVESYPEKLLAAEAAFRVRGVSALAQEISVHSLFTAATDADIAHQAGQALDRAVNIPDTVQVTVSDHEVTLTGQVDWTFQSQAAGRAMHHLKGVTGVVNMITIRPGALAAGVKGAIVGALLRNAELEGKHIDVSTTADGVVTLDGFVRSWAERLQAEQVCWSAPGVTSVVNQLEIR